MRSIHAPILQQSIHPYIDPCIHLLIHAPNIQSTYARFRLPPVHAVGRLACVSSVASHACFRWSRKRVFGGFECVLLAVSHACFRLKHVRLHANQRGGSCMLETPMSVTPKPLIRPAIRPSIQPSFHSIIRQSNPSIRDIS